MASLEDQTLKLILAREEKRLQGARKAMVMELKSKAPVDTGETRRKTTSPRAATIGLIWYAVMEATTPQAVYTDTGTGLFGPRHAYIYPKVAKALRWIDKASGAPVYARRVKGQGQHIGWFSETVKSWATLLEEN